MTGYTRQSAAEIINGQVINDTDFNNEFDALVAAFHATTGHAHDGTTGNGPKIVLTTSVSGVLPGLNGGITTSASDPTVNDDTLYAVGSVWFNTTTKTLFYCADNTDTAAVWVRVGRIKSSASAPAVTDDIDQGYIPGSVWLFTGTTPTLLYICIDNTNGAAVWYPLFRGHVYAAAGAPGVNDDSTKGYAVGSIGVNTSDSGSYICTDASSGAAVWTSLSSDQGQQNLYDSIFFI